MDILGTPRSQAQKDQGRERYTHNREYICISDPWGHEVEQPCIGYVVINRFLYKIVI